MDRKLLPNRISFLVTKEILEAFKAKIQEARALLPETPVVADEDLAKWEKMGVVRRAEITPTVEVFKKFGSFLPPVLSMEEVEKDLSFYDMMFDFVKALDAIAADLRRNQTIAGCEAVNVYRLAEIKAYSEANYGVADAISAINEINKLPRSSDKKPAKTVKKTSTKPES